MQRRTLAAAAAVCLALPGAYARAAARGTRIIVPFAAGGPLDITARFLAEGLEKAGEGSFWVQNKPGAAGVSGMLEAKKRKPDGRTLLVTGVGPLSVNPSILDKLPYDPSSDFTPITLLSTTPNVLVVTKRFAQENSISSFSDFIDWAKKNGPVPFASGGAGSIGHLALLELSKAAGIEVKHVPYPGAHPALLSLLSGDAAALIDNAANSSGLIRSGELVALAATTKERTEILPDVPTMAEFGIPIEMQTWICLLAPKGMKADLVEKIRSAVVKLLSSDEAAEKFKTLGSRPQTTTSEELARLIESDAAKYAALLGAEGGAK